MYLPASGTGVAGFTVLVAPARVAEVSVGTPLAADTPDGRMVGIVTDVSTVGTDTDPVLAANLAPTPAPSAAQETRQATLATVQTFHAPALRPARAGHVFHASVDDVAAMSGLASISCPVPAGGLRTGDGGWAPVMLDADELLGPLAAHLIVGGRSGAAAKTSYVTFLLAAALAATEAAGRTAGAVLFNVKGVDLLGLDSQPDTPLGGEDVELYRALGVPPRPFGDVEYYAPMAPGGRTTRSRRADASGIRWGLRDVWPYLGLLDRRFYDNDASFSLTAELKAHKIDTGQASTIDDLVGFLAAELEQAEEANRGNIWRSHHTATAAKIRRALSSLSERTGGLVSSSATTTLDVPTRLSPGQVVVVDVAGLEPVVQGAVVARTVRRLLDAAENPDEGAGGVGVDHLVVFADELNMFAPAHGGSELSRVRDGLNKVAATGRYAGVSLWGAAQFPSLIHAGLRDNAATWAVGAVADTELDSGVYGRLPAGVREQVVTAARGTMMVRSANLRSWTPVRFPRPAWSAGVGAGGGRVAASRPGAHTVLGVARSELGYMAEGVAPEVVDAVVARVDGDAGAAARELEKLSTPDMRRITGGEPSSSWSPDDPWQILDD